MDKKNIPQISLFKKTLIVLCILSGIEILCLTLAGLYDLVYITPRQKNAKNTFTIKASDIETKGQNTQESLTLADLEILPADYNTLTKSFGTFTPHELTTYLNYSEVLKTKDTTTLTNGYKYLEDSNLNILIPQSYIDEYLLSQVSQISTLMLKSSPDTTKSYFKTEPNTPTFDEAIKCISDNIDKFLNKETCQEDLGKLSNEKLSPTLGFLTESLKTEPLSSSNTYDKYIANQEYLYQIFKTENTTTQNEDTNKYTNDVYLDLDNNHIHKVQLILNYLKVANTQLDLNNTDIDKAITNLESVINELESYKYGNSVSASIKSIVNDSMLNLSTQESTKLNLNTQVQFLIKSFKINGEIKTFVAPMYILSSKTSTPIQAFTFEIDDNNFNKDYDVTPTTQSKGTVRIPIFMYHQITQVPAGQNKFQSGLYVDPEDFEKEMAYLVKKNYKSITTKEYYDLLMAGKNPTQKTVMITFDDGVENQYTNAYPILKKYNLIGVFYVISQRSAMTAAEMREMSDNGMIIDSHSAHHQDLTNMYDPNTLTTEVISSKYSLQATTGKTVYSFAYPGCGWNHTVVSYVVNAGYTLGMSCGGTIDNYPAYRYELSRVHAFGDMTSFKNLLSGGH